MDRCSALPGAILRPSRWGLETEPIATCLPSGALWTLRVTDRKKLESCWQSGYLLPGAAATGHRRLVTDNRGLLPPSLEAGGRDQVWQGWFLLRPRAICSLPLPAVGFAGIFVMPWRIGASPDLCLRLRVAFSCASPLFFPRGRASLLSGPLTDSEMISHRPLNYLLKGPFPKRGHSHSSWHTLGAAFNTTSRICGVAEWPPT